MPTPHGTRGGIAFSADELCVLRRALAEVLHPSSGTVARHTAEVPHSGSSGAERRTAEVPHPGSGGAERRTGSGVARRTAEVAEYLLLAEAVDEAVAEAGRLRVFLLDELRRYRAALPGSAAGYLERLTAAVAAGYLPVADDLAALRGLRALSSGTSEHRRRTALLRRCESLAENDVRLRLEAHMPAPRRLLALPGPSAADEPAADPAAKPTPKPRPKPAPDPAPAAPGGPKPDAPAPDPGRRTPTPAEIWPPGRRPAPAEPEDSAAVLAGLIGQRRAG